MDRSVKAETGRRAGVRPWFLKSRAWHHYIGMFIAPSLIFFALTGVAQTFDLHESHLGYTAPSLIVAAGSLHKDQILPKPEPSGKSDKPEELEPAPRYTPGQTLLKIYVTVVAVGLIASTLLGIVMALQNRVRRRTGIAMLVLGTLVPILIVLL